MMDVNKYCPNCGTPLGDNALEGLCPECMLLVGMDADSLPPPGADPTQPMAQAGTATPLVKLGDHLGRYKILHRLGEGGMGVVYEAEESDSGRRVALKILRQQLDSPQDRARFLREGRMAASINHPNCVYVFGTEEVEGIPTIAMEYIGGTTLAERLESDGPLPIDRAVDAMLQVMDGLEAAQTVGILHRDIKPSNCFEDSDGSIKIGDFGLSVSTLPRAETMITEAGALVGTPAFCSPEQLRGEELNLRSDLYAVGVTLYQLLTGRLPFEGKSMPQLIANTLEKKAPSPRVHRNDVPAGLARAVLRCLEKQPSDRFRSYADLRRVLAPYGSAAPSPATLGLRFLAGFLDLMLLSAIGQAVVWLTVGNPLAILDHMGQDLGKVWLIILPAFALAIGYYALSEWRWGATAGKAICHLRVVRLDRASPRLGQAFARATLYQVIPAIPYWIMAAINRDMLLSSSAGTNALGFTYYALLALLFATARRRNGFASAHDLLTETRIVSRTAVARRSVWQTAEPPLTAEESSPRIGPYHVLQTLDSAGDTAWVEGYDLRLLRRVLIRTVPPGTPPLPASIRAHARAGRLRWLTGRREGDEYWDAFEGVGGSALTEVAKQPHSWDEVRFWLHDLAAELDAGVQGDAPLPTLSMDRVWITKEGRAKLFDLPVPGSRESDAPSLAPQAFLDQVAAMALGGQATAGHPAADVARPLPVHARSFLAKLPGLDLGSAASSLQELLRRTGTITQRRRLAVVASCLFLPLVAAVSSMFGLSMLKTWHAENPGIMEMNQVLQTWGSKRLPFLPDDALPSDEEFAIYIASHYRDQILDESIWSSALARSLLNAKARAFAEQSVATYPEGGLPEQPEADKALDAIAGNVFGNDLPPTPKLLAFLSFSTLLIYVGLPAVIAALLFRGGLILLATGITFVRRDGRKASRLRLFWRALVIWAPLTGVTVAGVVAVEMESYAWLIACVVMVIALATWSLLLPVRGLPDRLAGTWPVPR